MIIFALGFFVGIAVVFVLTGFLYADDHEDQR